MGIIRSQSQLQCIFEDQKASGLTIIGYCREQQLSTATFYAARKSLVPHRTTLFVLRSPSK